MTVIRIFDLEGNFLEDVDNEKEAARVTKVALTSVYDVISGAYLCAGKFQFRKYNERTIGNIYKLSPIEKTRGTTKPVAKYWKDKLICVYNSIHEAASKNDMDISNIIKSCKNNTTLVSGFVFKYVN